MGVEEKVVSKLEGNRVSGRAKDAAVANTEVKERKLIRFDQQGRTHYGAQCIHHTTKVADTPLSYSGMLCVESPQST